jgi:hypothetical protein
VICTKVLDFRYENQQTTYMELHGSDSKSELEIDSDNGITGFRLLKFENRHNVEPSFDTTNFNDRSRRLEEAEMSASPTDNFLAIPNPNRGNAGRLANWVTLIGVEMPYGSYVHPGLLEAMKSQLRDHVPAIDWRTDGVRMSCRIYEEDEQSALEASRSIARSVLAMLTLDQAALVEFQVSPVKRPVDAPGPTLRLVR